MSRRIEVPKVESGSYFIPDLPNVRLYGLRVGSASLSQSARWILKRASQGVPTLVAALNAGKVSSMRRSPALRTSLQEADLVIADGVPVVWAAKLLGRAISGRVNGTDLMEATFNGAAEYGIPIYILGARAEVLEKAVQALEREIPSLVIAGMRHGYFSESDEEGIVRDIKASGARILYLAFPSPKKELFMARRRESLGGVVCLGVGGSIDVIAGVTKRAPVLLQRVGLEWFYRLIQEPRRMWRRYLVGNLDFVWITFREFLREWKQRASGPSSNRSRS